MEFLEVNQIYNGEARDYLRQIAPNSIDLSVWSPPYFVGKSYENGSSFLGWQALLSEVICLHYPILKPGGFLCINIADILCFKDPTMPKIQADNLSSKKSLVTRDDVVKAMLKHKTSNRNILAKILGCSEQTIDRRLKNNNIRGGKYQNQTKVKLTGGMVEKWGADAGFYLYDRRIWIKDPAWANSRWHSLSYRAVDEFEYVYIFWKPGITTIDRSRLSAIEWRNWGSRGVWFIPSVRRNDDHEAKFPLELPSRLIKLFSDMNDIILDPFVGSGTSAVAAIKLHRQFIGIDITPEYATLAGRNARLALWQERNTSDALIS